MQNDFFTTINLISQHLKYNGSKKTRRKTIENKFDSNFFSVLIKCYILFLSIQECSWFGLGMKTGVSRRKH